jgi:ankyrin repeat protein
MNALYFAVIKGRVDMIDLLVTRGANVNAKVNVDVNVRVNNVVPCEEEDTVLMASIKNSEVFDGVPALLRWGADITAKDLQGRTALHMTCYSHGQKTYDFLMLMVDSGADVNDRDNQGRTVLHYRVTERTQVSPAESALYLLAKGADPELKDIYGRNVFHYAANRGHVDVLTILHSVMKDPKAVDNYGMNALHFAAWRGNFDAVTYLISQGFAIDEVDYSGVSAIHLTAMRSTAEQIHLRRIYPPNGPFHCNSTTPPVVNGYLPDCYTNSINATDHLGRLPIHFAMMAPTPHMAQALLALGANATATDNEGNSAAHYAYANDREDYIPLLKGHGLDIHGWNDRMQSPLRMRQTFHSSRGFYVPDHWPTTVSNVDVHTEDSKKRTPLLLACSAGFHHNYIDALIQKGANPKTLDIDGMNAIHHYGTSSDIVDFDRLKFDRSTIDIFRDRRRMYIFKESDWGPLRSLKVLMDAGTDINAQDNNGDTPLHQATEKELCVKMQCLLQLGAKTDIKNNNGKTAKDIAHENNLKNELIIFNLYCGTA